MMVERVGVVFVGSCGIKTDMVSFGGVCVCVRVLFHIKFPMFNWFLLNECQFPMVQPITRQRY